jgi:NAD(P)-dependent dehydrogenase (short-subunit alcohol dehydrogenase family)
LAAPPPRRSRAGAQLLITARDGAALAALAPELRTPEVRVEWLAMDTADYDQVVVVGTRARELFGHVDAWVRVAGIGVYSTVAELRPEDLRRVIETDLYGPAYGAMVALPLLRERGGGLIVVSSVESEVGLPLQGAYAAAKHGVRGLLDVLRMELEHEGVPVSVTNIKPATINTPFFSNAATRLGVRPRAMPPVYAPERVAAAIVRAARAPRAEMVVGGAGYALIWGKRLLLRLTDRLLGRFAYEIQLTDRPAPLGDPGNRDAPSGDTRIQADALAGAD